MLSRNRSNFNPLPSHEGRRGLHSRHLGPLGFQSTPLSRGETDLKIRRLGVFVFQSTPLSRGETTVRHVGWTWNTISIHSPLTRGDVKETEEEIRRIISIHSPLTRGDGEVRSFEELFTDFNPLPSHEGRQLIARIRSFEPSFQSTPLSRGETGYEKRLIELRLFQSTPLSRGETRFPPAFCLWPHFNPLPSHEGRHGV